MNKEHLILVDEHDNDIGCAEKLMAHVNAWRHRAFSIFIINEKQELLLQKRHADKYHCGGLWTNTCCGHPRPGEDTLAAATRRLAEETGIHSALQYLGKFHYIASFDNGLTENEIDHVYCGHYDGSPLVINDTEIEEVRWVSIEELSRLLIEQPKEFTPWLQQALDILVNSI